MATPEVLKNVAEVIALQGLRDEQNKAAVKALDIVKVTNEQLEKRIGRPSDFGVGRNIQEQYYQLASGQVVRVVWRAPTVGTGDGWVEVRPIEIQQGGDR